MNETSVRWEETIHGGAAWSHVLKRGRPLRITDVQDAATTGIRLRRSIARGLPDRQKLPNQRRDD